MSPLIVVRIGERVDAERLLGVADVNENGVRGARRREQIERGIRRHVVAVARTIGHIRHRRRAWRPTRSARIDRFAELLAFTGAAESREDARARNDFGTLGVVERDLDDVELIERVGRIGRVVAVLAAGKFRFRTRGLLSRHVQVDDVLVRRARDQRVRVRAFARLHVLDQLGRLRIAHVEDAHAGHVILGILHAAVAAVVTVTGPFSREEEQVAVDGRIALRRNAADCRGHDRLGRVGDVPNGEAGEVGLVDVVAAEGEVRIDEREPARGVELRRLLHRRDQAHVLFGHTRVVPAGLEGTARVLVARERLRRHEHRRGDGCRKEKQATHYAHGVTSGGGGETGGTGEHESHLAGNCASKRFMMPISAVCAVTTSLANTLASTS